MFGPARLLARMLTFQPLVGYYILPMTSPGSYESTLPVASKSPGESVFETCSGTLESEGLKNFLRSCWAGTVNKGRLGRGMWCTRTGCHCLNPVAGGVVLSSCASVGVALALVCNLAQLNQTSLTNKTACEITKDIVDARYKFAPLDFTVTASSAVNGFGLKTESQTSNAPFYSFNFSYGSNPLVTEVTTAPKSPSSSGGSYLASSVVQCATRITMNVVGTDGYRQSQQCDSNSSNTDPMTQKMLCVMRVPVWATGVQDVITVFPSPSGGAPRTASLVFR